jgi:hypothetical protein
MTREKFIAAKTRKQRKKEFDDPRISPMAANGFSGKINS